MQLYFPGLVVAFVALTRLWRSPRSFSTGTLFLAGGGLIWAALAIDIHRNDAEAGRLVGVFAGLMLVAFLASFLAMLLAQGQVIHQSERLRASTVFTTAVLLASLSGFLTALMVVCGSFPQLPRWLLLPSWFVVLSTLVLAAQLAGFFCIALWYRNRRVDPKIDAVIALGCRLRKGMTVTRLLASRLDRAKQVYYQARSFGRKPVIVTSGGKGDDEKVAEGTAMAQYLMQQGVPETDLIAEAKSTSTEENLNFSTALLQQRWGSKNFKAAIVTSDLHALRAELLAKRAGYNYRSVGAYTAPRYFASAFLREFVAVQVYFRWNLIGTYSCLAVLAWLIAR